MPIEDINIGNSPNDGTGDKLRAAFEKVNNNTNDLDTRVQNLSGSQITAQDILRSGTATATGAQGERVNFSSEFTTDAQLIITDVNGIGIQVTAVDANGFNYDSINAGSFGWTALINV